jgi:hypothetical protein
MYSTNEKTEMILIYGECNKYAPAVRVYAHNKYFSKNSFRFFTILFNQANSVYVKLYKTARLSNKVLCFLNEKTNIHVNFANVLHFQFRRAHYYS